MTEIRVTIDEKLDALLDEIVASGAYPSKAEFVRSSIIERLKDLGLLSNLINPKKEG